jgi:hypothetical protein
MNLRKLALTLHVIASVGWIGAVACFLALAVIGLASPEIERVRASYVAMDVIYRWAIIPLGLASLVTGFVSSLSTEWGLFRYYWVLVKLLLTIPAALLMLVHAPQVGYLAAGAAAAAFSGDGTIGLRIQLIAYACAALLVLLAATLLSTYKPRGRTAYGARRLDQRNRGKRQPAQQAI